MSLLSAPGHLARLVRIGATFARTGAVTQVIDAIELRGISRFLVRVFSTLISPFGAFGDPRQPPLTRAFAALGPAEIKFGQTLATRPDVVGPKIARELRQLQDGMPPFDDAIARETIENELGRSIDALFTEFGPPVAAASIAQVHKAQTPEGRWVAVKVLRPGVERRFLKDIAAFRFAAKVIEAVIPASRRLKPVAVYEHFAEITKIELDLRLEASAAAEFAENIRNDEGFRLPEVDWNRSSQRVLTTDWIDGTPIGDIAAIVAQGTDKVKLAELVIQSFLKHALRDGLFHADMHQGNLRVDAHGRIVALDFGIMGRLDPMTRRTYAEILFSFLRRDYRRAAIAHRDAGYLPLEADLEAFAQNLRSVAEPIFGLGARNISMAKLLGQLFKTTEVFGMETRTELILLQKTMVMVEGVARDLDPDVNMWQAARPVVEEWMKENLGPKAIARDLGKAALTLSSLGPRLPEAAERIVMMFGEGGHPAPPPPPRPSLWPALLAGLLGGAAGAGLVVMLLG